MHYVLSDIHGEYQRYRKMLDKIQFKDEDTLYVLGDVIDRGDAGLKILFDMMLRTNVFPILGNHEYMMGVCSKFLLKEITKESIAELEQDGELFQGLAEWMNVGGSSTISEMQKLSMEERKDILNYLEEFSLWDEVMVAGKSFVLVHAGLSHFSPERSLDSYQIGELLLEHLDMMRSILQRSI